MKKTKLCSRKLLCFMCMAVGLLLVGENASATSPNSTLLTDPPLAGDYAISSILFKEVSGNQIVFEERVRTITKEAYISDAEINPAKYETNPPELRINSSGMVEEVGGSDPITDIPMVRTSQEYEKTYFVPMLNGVEYTGRLYHEFTDQDRLDFGIASDIIGVFATITEAVTELSAVGVDGPTRFLLLDATYPSETFPITFGNFAGSSAVNTVTLLPAAGVTTTIAAAVNQPIIRLSNASHVIIDGRQNGVSNPHSLTISQMNASNAGHGIQLIDSATHNTIQYSNIESAGAANAGNAAIQIGASVGNPTGNSMNLISNNRIEGGRAGIAIPGTAGNPNNQNVIQDNEIFDFGFTGVWLQSNVINTTLSGNEIYTTSAGIDNVNSGINIAASAGGTNNIFNNKLIDIQNIATTTLRGITLSAATGSVWNIYNNLFVNSVDNGTKTSIYMIQNSGSNAYTLNIYYNSFSLSGTHSGGPANTIGTGGFIKGTAVAALVINYKNNVVHNTRTGGDSIHLGTWFGSPAGVNDYNYNSHFALGGPTSFNAGFNGFVFNAIDDFRNALTPNEANSFFADPLFTSNVDLEPLEGSPLQGAGIPIAGIETDILGNPRSLFSSTIGAFELAELVTSVSLDGVKGWRTLSIPNSNSLQSFLDPVWTQGIPGSDYSSGPTNPQPNVFMLDINTNSWEPVNTLNQSLEAGSGFLLYLYELDIHDDETSNTWPKILNVLGTDFMAPLTVDNTRINSDEGGFSLLGNPFFSDISWDLVDREGIDNAVWVYDANAGLNGEWRSYVDGAGDLTDGLIASFQGFAVRSSDAADRSLTFTEDSKVTGAEFYKVPPVEALLQLEMSMENKSTSTWIRISENATMEYGSGDAIRLQPLTNKYMSIASLKDDKLVAIGSYPSNNDRLKIPLIIDSTVDGIYSIRVADLTNNSNWKFSILDMEEGYEHLLTENYRFDLAIKGNNEQLTEENLELTQIAEQQIRDKSLVRYYVIAEPITTSLPGSELPQVVALNQNYPNPFNPTT
ncbi:MAG: hypothetical protein LAT67_15275, partial [Balneolales bacterium]|nr:hypothetical protein [Balneolales bacterium]